MCLAGQMRHCLMKITCPNCTTSYQVPDDYLGQDGRKVRCANCGDTWLAKAQEAPAPDLEEGLDTSRDSAADIVSGGDDQSQDDIDALFDSPSGGGEDQSQDDIDALFDSPSGGGDDQSQDDIDALFDSPSGGGDDQSQDDIDALFDSPSGGGEEQSQDDVDALFDSPASDPAPKAAPASSEQDSPIVDMVDAAAFEAEKEVAKTQNPARKGIATASRPKRTIKARKKSKAPSEAGSDRLYWGVGAGSLVASLLLIGAFFLMPARFVHMSSDFARLYDILGMEVNLSGVSLQDASAGLQQKSGAPVVAVQANLVNVTAKPVLLPQVEVSVLGKDGIELYSWSVKPEGVALGPGESKRIFSQVAAPVQAKQVSLRVTPSN